MPNSFFKFKQFIVHQHMSAMKVCTDACVFGAWISKKISGYRHPVSNCLDIGTGTGLLSLMLAQKNTNTIIDAVEIEIKAFNQAKENFKISPWADRLNAIHMDIANMTFFNNYEFIITNPPFFAPGGAIRENDLRAVASNKKLAKHEENLPLEKLVNIIARHLKVDCHFAILLPYDRVQYFEKLAEQNKFFTHHKLLIRQTPLHNFFRAILLCGTLPSKLIHEELIIKNNTGEYTDDFQNLLNDYYLNL